MRQRRKHDPMDAYHMAYLDMVAEDMVKDVAELAGCSPRTLHNLKWERDKVSSHMAQKITGALLHYSFVHEDTQVADLFPRHTDTPVFFIRGQRPVRINKGSLAMLYTQWLQKGWVGRQTIVELAANATNESTRSECRMALNYLGMAS